MRKPITTKEEYIRFRALGERHDIGNQRHEIANFHSEFIAHGKVCLSCNDAIWTALKNIKAFWIQQKEELDKRFAEQDLNDYKSNTNGTPS